MLLVHACLLPLVVGVVVVWHVLLVRRHGVVPPIDAVADDRPCSATTSRQDRRPCHERDMTERRERRRRRPGVEGPLATLRHRQGRCHRHRRGQHPDGLAGGHVQLARRAAADVQRRGRRAPPDNFYATAVQELAGTSESAGYGPPYNTAGDGSVRRTAGASEMVRRHASGRPGQRLRHHAPALPSSSRPTSQPPSSVWDAAERRPAGRLGHRRTTLR